MTQYTDRIKKQEQKLTEEKLDQQVTSIDVRFGRIQTRYQSGRVVTEYPRDKRKNTITEYRVTEWSRYLDLSLGLAFLFG